MLLPCQTCDSPRSCQVALVNNSSSRSRSMAWMMATGSENQAAEQIIRSFQDLDSTARRATLHGLLDQLRRTEWREVCRRTAEISFHHDIVGDLPLEVVILITRHLDPRGIIRLQRVSKQWQRLLTSNAVYTTTLQQYAGRGTEETCSPEFFTKYFQRRRALETGHPYSHKFYPWDGPPLNPSDYNLSYCSGHLAWTSDIAEVVVRDFTSGAIARFVPESRAWIFLVQLSKHFLCVVTAEGYCTAWERSTGRKETIRLPSVSMDDLSIDDDKAAVIITYMTAPSTLLIWNLKTRSTQSVQVGGTPVFASFQQDDNTIIVVALDATDTPDTSKLVRHKFSLTKSAIVPADEAKSLAVLPGFGPSKFVQYYQNYRVRDESTITQVILNLADIDNKGGMSAVLSSHKERDEMSVQVFQNPSDDLWYRLRDWEGRLLTSDGILYVLDDEEEHDRIRIFDISRPEITRVSEHMDLSKHRTGPSRCQPWQAFGDSQVYGLLHANGIEVWSFDPEFDLNAGSPNKVEGDE